MAHLLLVGLGVAALYFLTRPKEPVQCPPGWFMTTGGLCSPMECPPGTILTVHCGCIGPDEVCI